MRTPLEHFTKDLKTGVLLHPDYSGFDYSDGVKIEQQIYDVLKTSVDRSCNSTELQANIIDWPTEYHFTPVRHNLLRHLDVQPHLKVLELGAGCGAITRQLGETGATITAIEGGIARARATSERCRDLPNVKVHCSDFNKVLLEPVYDIVTLIGVLEYAPIFTDTSDPILDALRFARSALKPGGRLIVAIENQLGLKYFCGATEDHLAEHYLGLEDRYSARSVRTLGKQDLHTNFKNAGFTSIEFQYPFPDYKLPSAVIFEEAFIQPDFLPDEIIRHMYARDYSGRGTDSIDASLVWPVLARNGLIQDLANSFLIIASDNSYSKSPTVPQPLAVIYTNDRARQFNTITEFVRESGGHLTTKKRKLTPVESISNGVMTQHLADTPYVCARTLHSEILAATKRRDQVAVMKYLGSWIEFLIHHGTESGTSTWLTPMPPHFVDCTPCNLLLTNSGLHPIDQEWMYTERFTLGSLILRYLTPYAALPAATRLFDVPDQHLGREIETIRRVIAKLELVPDDQAYQDYVFLHDQIVHAVFPDKREYTNELLSKMLSMPDVDVTQHISKIDQIHEQDHNFQKSLQTLGRYADKLYNRHIGWRFK